MTDFSTFDLSSSEAWKRLAENLLIKAQNAVIAVNDAELANLQVDFQEFAQRATLACPGAVLTAVNRGQSQLAQARIALNVKNLKERGLKMEITTARMSSAVNELRATTALLQLETIREALDVASVAAMELKVVRSAFATLPKEDLQARLDAIAASIDKVVTRLADTLVQ